jgi:hypothetical protein
MQSHPHLYTKIPRPTMPQFLSGEVASEGTTKQDDSYLTYLEEYKRLGDEFQETISVTDFSTSNKRTDPEELKGHPTKSFRRHLEK